MSRTAHKLMASGAKVAVEIEQSLMLSVGDASKLRRTPTSEGNRKTFTFSTWCKRSKLGTGGGGSDYFILMGAFVVAGGSTNDSHYFQFGFDTDNKLVCSGWSTHWRKTTRLFRDPSAWHHLVLQVDTTQGTADNRIKIYVDGVEETSFGTKNNPSQNYDLAINNTVQQAISDTAYDQGTGPYHFDGYMAETYLIDGTIKAPTDFGETDSATGQWIPKKYTGGAYGTNGFYLDFANNTENGITAAASTFTAPFGGTASNATADDGNYIVSNTTTGGSFDLWHVDLGSVKNVVSILQHNMRFTGGTSTFKVYSSNDNQAGLTNWTERASFSVSSSYQDLNTSQGVAARYWKMRATAFGVNGEGYVDFVNLTTGGIGADASGQGNDYSASNLAASDIMLDTPTNNYCTLNPLGASGGTFTQGNLKVVTGTNSGTQVHATMRTPSSGKWYWEAKPTSIANGGLGVGIGAANAYYSKSGTSDWPFNAANTWAWYSYGSNGYTYINGTQASSSYTFTNNDVIGVALDLDAGTITMYKNGSSQFQLASSLSGQFQPVFSDGSSHQQSTFEANFGQKTFTHTPPSGFKALNTSNLPTPAAKNPTQHFNTVLYTGNETARSITGVGFEPSLVWIKERSGAGSHRIFEQVRGVNKVIQSDLDTEELDRTEVTAFNADGFSLSDAVTVNQNSLTHVAWNWKAGGSGSANTDGSINSTVSANTTAGFSIVTWTGDGSTSTVGHGLGAVPQVYIMKRRDSANYWWVGTTKIDGSHDYAVLDTAVAFSNSGLTVPTSSVFYTDGSQNTNNATYVAYAFAEVEGFSKYGVYTGNGDNTDGPFVNLGFKPAWLMIHTTAGGVSWIILDSKRDPFNEASHYLLTDLSNAEADYDRIDFLSNGFKLKHGYTGDNSDGVVYFYMAFAESPFKYANAR